MVNPEASVLRKKVLLKSGWIIKGYFKKACYNLWNASFSVLVYLNGVDREVRATKGSVSCANNGINDL